MRPRGRNDFVQLHDTSNRLLIKVRPIMNCMVIMFLVFGTKMDIYACVRRLHSLSGIKDDSFHASHLSIRLVNCSVDI